jgi:hypothetical protein
VFRGWLGDRTAYASFTYGDLSWQCATSQPVGIDPPCVKSGIDIGGALPDDMRRGGTLQWPPASTGYPWEALQGATLEAELLRAGGYDAWSWSNKAILRAVRFLYERAHWPATGDDEWQTWLIDRRYGTSYHGSPPARGGKNFGFTDWLYGPSSSGSTPASTPAPTATPRPTTQPTSGSDDLAEPDAHTESDPGDDRFADGCADCGADADRRFERVRLDAATDPGTDGGSDPARGTDTGSDAGSDRRSDAISAATTAGGRSAAGLAPGGDAVGKLDRPHGRRSGGSRLGSPVG